MAQRVVIPGFRKIEISGDGEGGTSNYNDLTNKPSINNVPLVGNLKTVDLKLTDATLTEEGVPAEAKTVGTKLEEQSTSLNDLSRKLGNHTVKSDVPENAVFTDTIYDDTEVKGSIEELNSNLVSLNESLEDYGLVNKANGWLQRDSSRIVTPKTSCTEGKTIRFIADYDINYFGGKIVLFYNSSGTQVGDSFSIAKQDSTFTVPSGATSFEVLMYKDTGVSASGNYPYSLYVNNSIDELKNDLDRIEGISTTEQIVGTFLGKNLYRNTVVLNFSTPFTVASGNNDTCITSSTGMESQASSYEGNIQWNSIDTLVNSESFVETSSYIFTNPFIFKKDKTGYWYCRNIYGETIAATKIVLTLYYTKYN